MRRRAAVALGLSVVLLGIFITLVGWDDVLDSIERASLSVYAIAVGGSLATLAFRSEVWRRVLSVVDQPRPYWLVASVFTTATFIKYVTPYGQVASGVGNAAIVSRYTDAAYEESLAAVVSADVMTYVPYYTFGLVGVVYLFAQVSPPIDPEPYLFPAVGMVAIVAFIALFVWVQRSRVSTAIVRVVVGFRGVVARISPRRAAFLTRENVERRLQDFTLTLELVSRNRRSMTLALVYGHLAWLGLALALYASAAAVGTPLPVGIVLLSVALSKLGFVVPTPGGLGGVEATLATVVYLLAPSGVGMTVATATAIAILYRFATYWLTVAVGGTTSVALTIVDPRPAD